MGEVGKFVDIVGTGLKHLVPTGGVKHPDSLITKGPNRSLYLPGKGVVSPTFGGTPSLGKGLLVGRPKRNRR